jgi:hypothetical protein
MGCLALLWCVLTTKTTKVIFFVVTEDPSDSVVYRRKYYTYYIYYKIYIPLCMYMCVCECLWYIFRPLGLWPTSLEVPCSFCSSLELLAVTMFSCWRTCCSNLPVTTCVIVCPVYDLFFCMKVFQVAVSKGLVESDARGLRIAGAPSEVSWILNLQGENGLSSFNPSHCTLSLLPFPRTTPVKRQKESAVRRWRTRCKRRLCPPSRTWAARIWYERVCT